MPQTPTNGGECPLQMQMSAHTPWKCVIKLWWTRQTLLWQHWSESSPTPTKVLTWILGDLSDKQPQNELKFNLKLNLALGGKANYPQNNKQLNQGVLHLWSKFGDFGLNGCHGACGQANDWYTHGETDSQTHKHLMSHGLNQFLPSLLICVHITRPQWVRLRDQVTPVC